MIDLLTVYECSQCGEILEDVVMTIPDQWVFGGIERFAEPIPAKGKQGLWEFKYE